MKYIITGSTGHISKPLTQILIAAGHEVSVITSKASKTAEIESLGAKALVGSVEDADFLVKALAGADAAYLMIPPNDKVTIWIEYQKAVANNYLAAIKANNTKHVLFLSSIGAHMRTGCGPVDGPSYFEAHSEQLTESHIHFLRPGSFYYNFFAQIGMIKHAGMIADTQPADFRMVLVHPTDIANAAAAYLLNPGNETRSIEYVVSDDGKTWADITRILGTAIGKPELPYVQLTDDQSRAGMLQAGLNPAIVDGFIQMGKALRDGDMQADYWKSGVKPIGKIKLEDFAKEFAGAYNAS